MIDLAGRAALVTGGSRGIGRAIVLRLARQGADVAFSFKGNQAAADATMAEVEALGRRGLAIQADARSAEGADALVKEVLAAFGKIDILVNNAGITRDDLIMRMSTDAWTEVLETNLFGAFYALKACTRPMLRAKGGRIINITSVSGQAGQMGQANYSAAKAGLIGLTKAAARELASRNITVNAVAPGFVLTELTQDLPDALKAEITARTPLGRFGTTEEIANAVAPGFVLTELTQDLPDALKAEITARTPLGRFGTTEEIANAVAFLASDEAAYITGQVLAVDGGLVMM
jgi:3-oxoacyl-[acyl-carrier protein] reductase